ncbi:MAG: metalloregulator ArsR/SmtB family transcription factor [Pseudomonadota bacterium]
MQSLDPVFAALSDPTPGALLALLARLAEGETTVSELARPFEMSQPAISRHLKLLESAGLVLTRVIGTSRPRRLNPDAFVTIDTGLDRNRRLWADNYNRLDTLPDDLKDDRP